MISRYAVLAMLVATEVNVMYLVISRTIRMMRCMVKRMMVSMVVLKAVKEVGSMRQLLPRNASSLVVFLVLQVVWQVEIGYQSRR